MKYFSLFSGIGGFELGLDRHECVGYSEIDRYAIEVYEKHFKHRNYGDITKIKSEELPEFELVVGGFPCQAFSIAGLRGGFEDTRGTLFFEIARIIRDRRPRLVLLENVKGLLSHDKGKTFRTIIATFTELGYDVQWELLNSKNFGVPQSRERVYIVGHLRNTPRPEVFPIRERYKGDIGANGEEKEAILAHTVNTRTGRLGKWEQYIVALTSVRTEESKKIRREMLKQGRDWYPRQGRELIPRTDGQTNTVTARQSKENLLLEGERIRRLTPLECERLQGFPDNWTLGLSDTQRYKTIGNAVTVNVIKEINKKLK